MSFESTWSACNYQSNVATPTIGSYEHFPKIKYVVAKMMIMHNFNECKKKGKYKESIQSSTTPDPGYQWESDNVTIRHHERESRGQSIPSR